MNTTALPMTNQMNQGAAEFRRAVSRGRLWTGRSLFGFTVAFMLFDAAMKLVKPVQVVQATLQLGYPEMAIVPIGVALLACVVLYMIPRTAVFGAILLTGYLGGAVASNVRAQTPAFNLIFPFVFAVLVWAALVLRDTRIEDLIFGRSESV